MQDDQRGERQMDNEAAGRPVNLELLEKCVRTYRFVTTLRPTNGERVLDYLTLEKADSHLFECAVYSRKHIARTTVQILV